MNKRDSSEKLSELGIINPSKKEITAINDSLKVTFLPMSSVDEVEGKIMKYEIKSLGEVRRGFTYFKENDVLFAKITPSMENGKVAIAKNLKNGIGFGSTEFHVIRPKSGILSEWIYYFLRQESLRKRAQGNMVGTAGQQRVPIWFMDNIDVPNPSEEIQKRIITKIELLLDKIYQIKKLKKEIAQDFHNVFPSCLHEVFTDSFESQYNTKRLDECFNRVDSGTTPRKIENNYVLEGVPFIKVNHITKDGRVIIRKENPQINPNLVHSKMKRSIVSAKSGLLNIVGPPLGKIGIIGANVQEACINQAIVSLSEPIGCVPEYVWYCLRSPRYNQRLINLGVGIRQSNINTSEVREFRIPIPKIDIQKQIVNQLDMYRTKTELIIETEKITFCEIGELTESIFNKAFRLLL